MSISRANKIYRSLSADQKKLIDEKQISATLQVREWAGFLHKAARYDELGDHAIRQYRLSMIILVILSVVSLIVTIYAWQYGLPALVLLLLILVFIIGKYRKFVSRDLTNHLRLFLLPLLFVLKDKAGDKERLSLSIDLHNPKKVKPVNEFQQGNTRVKLYEPKYVIGKVRLLDEAGLEFVLQDEIRAMQIRKRSASGKTKIKFKDKISRFYFIKLSFPKKYYQVKNGSKDSVRLSENDEFIICKVKVKTKSTDVKAVVAMEDFLKSMDELYELTSAKPGAKLPESVAGKTPGGKAHHEEAEEMEDMDDTGYEMVPFMVWNHAYFTDYDYDSFSTTGQPVWDEADRGDSFFDS